jgi:hypothetical protein
MKKYMLSILCLVFLIGTIAILIYYYFYKGRILLDGWGTLVIILSIYFMYINYWKEHFLRK